MHTEPSSPPRGRLFVIGAGLSGLSASLAAIGQGWPGELLFIHEGTGQAGGRARSFDDAQLGMHIDTGNHLLLSGTDSTMAYLALIGAQSELVRPSQAGFPFVAPASNESWRFDPGPGRMPWRLLSPQNRPPGMGLATVSALWRLARCRETDTVADRLGADVDRPIFSSFWEPLCLAIMNATPQQAACLPLLHALSEIFAKGGERAQPLLAHAGLSQALIDPGLRFLAQRNAGLHFHSRLSAVAREQTMVSALVLGGQHVVLSRDDRVILALPPAEIARLLPECQVPNQYSPIVNWHARLALRGAAHFARPGFLGLIGTPAHWLFWRDEIISATISAADQWIDRSEADITSLLWPGIRRALQINGAILANDAAPPELRRVIKEKRATILQTPHQQRLRPPARTAWKNLFLAGDWTRTGLPSTLEGAIRSGHIASLLARHSVSAP